MKNIMDYQKIKEQAKSVAAELIEAAIAEHPDVLVLPETWNTGFFPADLAASADVEGRRTKEVFSALAKELGVNIVCGSVANRKADGFYNTAYVFDLLLGDDLQGRKAHIAENGYKYLEMADIS